MSCLGFLLNGHTKPIKRDESYLLAVPTLLPNQLVVGGWHIYIRVPSLANFLSNSNESFQKKTKQETGGGGGGGVEDMEFSHVLKKEHVEIPGVNFNKHRIAEFPWVLVFNLGLQFNFQGKGVSHNFAWNFQEVKVCFLWKF